MFFKVTYFCHHLSDNYVDLSDHYVDLSEKNHKTCNSVLVAYHTNCQISMLTCQIFHVVLSDLYVDCHLPDIRHVDIII